MASILYIYIYIYIYTLHIMHNPNQQSVQNNSGLQPYNIPGLKFWDYVSFIMFYIIIHNI